MPKHKSLFELILKKAKEKRRRVGITITRMNPEILDSLKKAKSEVEVVIYGINVPGFECIEMKPEDEKGTNIGVKIVEDFKAGKVDQFVRGQVDDFGVVDTFKKLFNIPKEKKRFGFGLLRDYYKREFFACPISNPEGQTLEHKIEYADFMVEWMQNFFKLLPKVAVMATCRPGSYGRDPVMTKSYDHAEAVVKHLKDEGIEAKNVHIEIEKAVTWANLIIPANGTIGNQLFRSLVYLGGGKLLASPTVFPDIGMYEDDSRNETDWYPHLIAAAAWANMSQ